MNKYKSSISINLWILLNYISFVVYMFFVIVLFPRARALDVLANNHSDMDGLGNFYNTLFDLTEYFFIHIILALILWFSFALERSKESDAKLSHVPKFIDILYNVYYKFGMFLMFIPVIAFVHYYILPFFLLFKLFW